MLKDDPKKLKIKIREGSIKREHLDPVFVNLWDDVQKNAINVNTLQELLNQYYSTMQNAISFKGDIEVIPAGETRDVGFTFDCINASGTVMLDIYKDGVQVAHHNATSFPYHFTISNGGTGLYRCEADVNGIKYVGLWDIKESYDFWIGTGVDYNTVLANPSYKHVGASSLSGTYFLNPNAGDYIYIICRSNVVPASITMSGFEVPFAIADTATIAGVEYSVYASGNTYQAGNIELVVNDIQYDTDSYIAHLIEEVITIKTKTDDTEEKVETIADEETIEVIQEGEKQGKIALKNRPMKRDAVTDEVIQKGYVILKEGDDFKEVVESYTDGNIIFEIDYAYDLDGESVTIPNNCILKFAGGSIANGILIGNETVIDAKDALIFKKSVNRYKGYTLNGSVGVAEAPVGTTVVLDGTWANDHVSISWNGLDTISENEDASPFINDYILLHKVGSKISLPTRIYGIYKQIMVEGRVLDANNSIFNVCSLANIYSNNVQIPTDALALNSTKFPRGLPLMYNHIHIKGQGSELKNLTIDQANIEVGDVVLDTWGIYGLCGKSGNYDVKITNVHFNNAAECGFLGINGTGNITFENCSWNGSGEHEVYGIPVCNSVVFKNCSFTNWENLQAVATARGTAFAIKIVESANTVATCNLVIENCIFTKGSSYSTYMANITAETTLFKNCKTDTPDCAFNLSSDITKVLTINVDGCDGIPCDITCYPGIYNVKNSRGTSVCMRVARFIENCTLEQKYISMTSDTRGTAPQAVTTDARYLDIKDTVINVNGNADESLYAVIVGAYYVTYTNCKIIDDNGHHKYYQTFKTNTSDTAIEDVSPTLVYDSCDLSVGQRYTAYLNAAQFDVTLKDTTINGYRYFDSGYNDKLCAVKTAKTLTINNSSCVAYKNGTVLDLYSSGVTSITTVTPTLSPSNPSSNAGLIKYDSASGKYLTWNGTKWVEEDGATAGVTRSGTFANKPAAANIYVGFKYFCTDKQTTEGATNGIEIIHKGSDVWVDALGRVVS